MIRAAWSAALLTILAGVLVAAAPAGPLDPPFPSRINFPPSNAGFSPEGIAVSGTTFYAPNTGTGGVIKGSLETGVYDANFIPNSPATPSAAHRSALGAQVDSHGRLWVAGNLGANVPAENRVTKGCLFVWDAATGVELAVYKVTDATSRTMNDMIVTDTDVWVSDTSAPNGAGTEVQHVMKLGPGGALPPGGEIGPDGLPLDQSAGPDFTDVPTPGFGSSDGIDVLPNGSVLMNAVSGTDGRMIVIDPDTWKVTNVAVTTPNEPDRPASLVPLLSGDGITVDGNVVYYPENRAINAACPAPNANLTCPGDVAVVVFDPATDYKTAKVVARLNNSAGIPPLRSVANLEEYSHFVYAVTRDAAVGGVTQTYLSKIDKDAPNLSAQPVLQTEAGPAFSGPVATVLDPGTATAAGLSASIDWGDGSPASVGTVTGSAGFFTISGTHNYTIPAAPPLGNPFVTVSYTNGPKGTSSSTTRAAVLANAAITATAPTMSGAANTALTWSSTFSDAGVPGTAANYTAAIVWGDGTANTNGTITAIPGDGYSVTATHTFTRSGVYAPRVTVTDNRGGTGAATGSANISGPAETPLAVTGVARTGYEGTPIGNTAVATFTDPNVYASGPRPVAQYTAPIDWGDGSATTNGTVVFNAATGVFTVNGNHIYAKDGSYTVTVTPVSLAGTTGTGSATATIADADTMPLPVQPAPPAQPVASPPLKSAKGTTLSGVEGSSISGVVASFSDPRNAYGDASHFTATINWGDGSPATAGVITQLSYTRYTVSGSHAYAQHGSYTASVVVSDAGGTDVSASSPVTVANAAITATGTTKTGVERTPVTGTFATIHDSNPLGSAADFTASINWGDGSPASAGTVSGTGGTYPVSGSHTYEDAGTYTVTVNVQDNGGATATARTTVVIGFQGGCTRSGGKVEAEGKFDLPGVKKDVHIELEARCDERGHSGVLDLKDAHAKVDVGGTKLIDAKTGGKSTEIATVKIVGATATIVGTDNGNSFVIVVTDGGKKKDGLDRVSVVVTNAAGNVVFESSTLTAKHDLKVKVDAD